MPKNTISPGNSDSGRMRMSEVVEACEADAAEWMALAVRVKENFPGFEEELLGAVHTGAPVEKDGNIITARGAGVALEFALELVALLKGEAVAKALKESLQCA